MEDNFSTDLGKCWEEAGGGAQVVLHLPPQMKRREVGDSWTIGSVILKIFPNDSNKQLELRITEIESSEPKFSQYFPNNQKNLTS